MSSRSFYGVIGPRSFSSMSSGQVGRKRYSTMSEVRTSYPVVSVSNSGVRSSFGAGGSSSNYAYGIGGTGGSSSNYGYGIGSSGAGVFIPPITNVQVNSNLLTPMRVDIDPEIQKVRTHEKEQIKTLNNRFAGMIDKVSSHFLSVSEKASKER